MTNNFKPSFNVKRAIQNLSADLDDILALGTENACGFCGTLCREQDDFCSPRCERQAQGGKEKAAKKVGWDG